MRGGEADALHAWAGMDPRRSWLMLENDQSMWLLLMGACHRCLVATHMLRRVCRPTGGLVLVVLMCCEREAGAGSLTIWMRGREGKRGQAVGVSQSPFFVSTSEPARARS